jgi:hypothetical protein
VIATKQQQKQPKQSKQTNKQNKTKLTEQKKHTNNVMLIKTPLHM